MRGVANETVAWALPATTVTPVGAPGTVIARVVVERIEPVEVPAEFTA